MSCARLRQQPRIPNKICCRLPNVEATLTNRAHAHLRLGHCEHCIADCDAAAAANPLWLKVLFLLVFRFRLYLFNRFNFS
jgi:hypothetical protein